MTHLIKNVFFQPTHLILLKEMYFVHKIYVPIVSRKPVPPAIMEGNHKDKYNKNKSSAMEFQLDAIACQRL